jgi:hypothetical protein
MAHSGSKPDSREPMNVQSSDPTRFIDTLRIGPVSPGKSPRERYCNMSAAGMRVTSGMWWRWLVNVSRTCFLYPMQCDYFLVIAAFFSENLEPDELSCR